MSVREAHACGLFRLRGYAIRLAMMACLLLAGCGQGSPGTPLNAPPAVAPQDDDSQDDDVQNDDDSQDDDAQNDDDSQDDDAQNDDDSQDDDAQNDDDSQDDDGDDQ